MAGEITYLQTESRDVTLLVLAHNTTLSAISYGSDYPAKFKEIYQAMLEVMKIEHPAAESAAYDRQGNRIT